MPPEWLTALAWAYLALCLGCAAIASYDIAVGRRRQPMGVMNFVFPITALYLGPLALWFYWRHGRAGPEQAGPGRARAGTAGLGVGGSRRVSTPSLQCWPSATRAPGLAG